MHMHICLERLVLNSMFPSAASMGGRAERLHPSIHLSIYYYYYYHYYYHFYYYYNYYYYYY